MSLRSRQWKKWVRWALLVLAVADVMLVVLRWQTARAATQQEKDQLVRLQKQHDTLGADVERAATIRGNLNGVEHQCNRFVAEQLLDTASGYSALVEDLGRISEKSGLETNSVSYKQRALEKRDVQEVEVQATVQGDYPSLVRFINGLERSSHFYLLDSLTLAPGSTGGVRLNLTLRTYFRAKS